MITVPVFQFMAVRFALLAQGSDIRARVCGEGFQIYFLAGKSYEAAYRWIEQLYSNYYQELHQYGKRLNRQHGVATADLEWIAHFTNRFLRAQGFEPDRRIILLHAGQAYPPLLGMAARQLSAPALNLLYELAALVQRMPQGTQADAERQLESLKQVALKLNRAPEVFITGIPIIAVQQALIHKPLYRLTDEKGYYQTVSISHVLPRIDLSEPEAPWLPKDRSVARRLLQTGSRF